MRHSAINDADRSSIAAHPRLPRIPEPPDENFGSLRIFYADCQAVRNLRASPIAMRIAVIADTHNRHPAKLPKLLTGADEIWHLGDVCEPEALDAFAHLGPPLRVVLGNNDFHPAWPLTLRLEREGVRFHLEHIPPRRPPVDCDVVLHGHTHVPRDETLHGVRWLNPGCISYANRGAPASFAWLTLEKDRQLDWRLVRL